MGLCREQRDGNHVGRELEDDGRLAIVGQVARNHVELVAHVVSEHVNVVTVLKLERNDRDVLARV